MVRPDSLIVLIVGHSPRVLGFKDGNSACRIVGVSLAVKQVRKRPDGRVEHTKLVGTCVRSNTPKSC